MNRDHRSKLSPLYALPAKLQRPAIGKPVHHFARCLNVLKRETSRSLVMFVAPAGYGKTTLMSAWADTVASRGSAVGWLSLEPEDNDLHRFMSCLISALPVETACKEELLELLDEEPEGPPSPKLLATIVRTLNSRDEVYLFLDHYEAVHENAVHRIIEYVIAQSNERVHVCIASREKPLFRSNMRTLHPGPLILTQDHLKLNAAEIRRFMKRTTNLQLRDEEAQRLERETEGWLPALLACSSLLRGGRAQSFDELPPIEAVRYEVQALYLNDLLMRQPQELRQFMLLTSIPDFFHAELGYELTEDSQYIRHIEQLMRKNLFLFQEANGRYRYHPLFGHYLRATFMQADGAGVRRAHKLCSEWFDRRGFVPEAVRHALQIADYERASGLLLTDIAATFSCPKPLLMKLLSQFPGAEMYQRPSIAMVYAWVLTAEHRITAAETVLQRTEALMTEDRYVFSPTGEDLRGYFASIYSRIYFLRRDTAKGMAYMKEAESRLNGPGYLYNHVNTHDPGGNSLLKSDVGHWGAIRQSVAMCEYAQARWKGVNQGYGLVLGLLGECYYEQGKLGKAETLLLNARKIGRDLMDAGLLLPTSVTLVQLKQAIGEDQAARMMLEETEKLLGRHAPQSLSVIHACRTRLAMKAQQRSAVKKWLALQARLADGEPDKRDMYEYLTVLRAYLFLHQYKQGIRFGEKLLQFSSALYLQYYIAEIHLLLAALYAKEGDLRTAWRNMEHAVSVSREEGYVQLFADVWDLAESIVRRFAKQKQSSGEVLAFVEQLIRNAGDKELYADRSGYARKKLSPKEYQVLQYLLEGKSNAAIGETMNISVETVKTHCKNIYKKLNLSSRKEVQKAFH